MSGVYKTQISNLSGVAKTPELNGKGHRERVRG